MKRNLASGAPPAGRSAFTLVELLIVVSIVALLVGLVSAAAMKFKDVQIANTTDTQLAQYQQKLSEDYTVVVKKASKEPLPAGLVQNCGNEDRARLVHVAATVAQYFPERFAEAKNGVTVPAVYGSPVFYPPKSTFKAVWNLSATEQQERAVLLYLIVNERSVSGGTSDVTGATGTVRTLTLGGTPFSTYVDLYGQEVVFYRWAQWSSVNGPAPVTDLLARTDDPLDRSKLICGWTDPTVQSQINTLRSTPTLGFAPTSTTPWNRVPTVVGYGKNKVFDGFQLGSDDRAGYRLIGTGGKGDLDQ